MLQDYSLSQTTLNDVFVHFVNEQRDDAGLDTLLPPLSIPVEPVHSNLPDVIPEQTTV